MMSQRIIILSVACLLIAACGRETVTPLPQGEQSVTGRLESVPFSLARRGTHGLVDAGGSVIAYAESRQINLQPMEGRIVTLKGVYEVNTDATLAPVLVVSDVVDAGSAAVMTDASIPTIGIRLRVPAGWILKSAEFTATGTTVPLLSIATRHRAGTGSAATDGTPLPVGTRVGNAVLDATRQLWIVRVQGTGNDDIVFSFALRADVPVEKQLQEYRRILQTVVYPGEQHPVATSSAAAVRSDTPSSTTTSATGAGMPCGGLAGILCPAGYFCNITDTTTESGTCVQRAPAR